MYFVQPIKDQEAHFNTGILSIFSRVPLNKLIVKVDLDFILAYARQLYLTK